MSEKGNTPIVGSEKDMEMGRSPDYGSSNKDDGNDAPPAYGSWYEKFQYAKDKSESPAQFPLKSLNIFMGKCEDGKKAEAEPEQKKPIGSAVFWSIFNMGLPIAMVVIGSIYLNDCPLEPMIPIYLIVSGAFQIFRYMLDITSAVCKRYRDLERDENGKFKSTIDMKALNFLNGLIGAFLIAFFIAGNVWVYGNWAPSNNPNSPRWCNPTAYYYTFWTITGTYIFFGVCLLFVCLCCCVGCCAVCFCKKK